MTGFDRFMQHFADVLFAVAAVLFTIYAFVPFTIVNVQDWLDRRREAENRLRFSGRTATRKGKDNAKR